MPATPSNPSRKRARRGKVVDLAQAIRDHVEPGISLHLAGGIGGPSAAIAELMRRFAGQAPGITLIQSTVCGHALNLVHAGLVRKLVCAVAAEIAGSARPSPVIQQAIASGVIELESASLLALQQRLMAAAFGVPFMPTRSIVGSDLEREPGDAFRALADPFGSGTNVGLVRALAPDLSIVHGCIADEAGNTVLAAPGGEDLWGALASRRGVIVTVERVVPGDTLRRHAALVKIPSHRVVAVCEAPLGLHPYSLPNPGLVRFSPYEKDTGFLDALGRAARQRSTLDAWLDEWVHACTSHSAYLAKLGRVRIAALRAQAKARPLPAGPMPVAGAMGCAAPSADETMLVMLAREIAASVRRSGHRVVLAGAGVAATAAFVASFLLRDEGIAIELLTGNGQYGYTPIPGASVLATEAGVRSSKMLSDTLLTQGVLVGGAASRCLSVLGAGQVDRHGAINSSRTADGRFLVGSGGANDALNAAEVIVVLNQSRERFVERLPYRTGPGDRVTTVVSSMAVLRKPEGGDELELAALFPADAAAGRDASVASVCGACGWPLVVRNDLAQLERPTERELVLLRWLRAEPGDETMKKPQIPAAAEAAT